MKPELNAHPRTSGPATAASAASIDRVDWQTATLVDALRHHVLGNGEAIAYTYLIDGETQTEDLSFAALDLEASRMAAQLLRFCKPGDRVVLLFPDGLGYIKGLFACLYAGVVAVSGVHPSAPRAIERFQAIVRDSQASAVIGAAEVLADMQRSDDEADEPLDIKWLAYERLASATPSAADELPGFRSRGTDLCVLQYTSGSTRSPRGVMLTHRSVLHNLESQMSAFGYRAGDFGVSWLPFSHDMGLIGAVLMAAFIGARCILLAPSHFLEKPERWLQAISRYRATISGGPNFAYDLCARRIDAASIEGLDLSCWQLAFSGAETVRPAVLDAFAQAFEASGFRREAFYPCYGLAEATLFVSGGRRLAGYTTVEISREALALGEVMNVLDHAAEPGDGKAVLVGCGRGLADQKLCIVDPQSLKALGDDQVGEIWVAGPSIAPGYYGRDQETAECFGQTLAAEDGAFLRTGDLGFLREGTLFVTGRLRDLIIIRGKNHYPQDIEEAATIDHDGVRKGSIAAFAVEGSRGSDLALVAEINGGYEAQAEALAGALRRAVLSELGLNPRHVVLVRPGSVLKTPSGKLQRSQTREAWRAGQLSVVHESHIQESSMPEAGVLALSDLEAWFLAHMRAIGLSASTLAPSTRLTEMGFDSVKILELKSELENCLGFDIPLSDIYRYDTLSEFSAYLIRRAGRTDGAPSAQPPKAPAVAPRAPSAALARQRENRVARQGSLD